MGVRAALTPIVACLASITFAACGGRALAECRLQIVAESPIALVGRHPLIRVQVNGSALPVVLDTGASFNLLTYDAAAKLRLRLGSLGHRTMSGVGGAGNATLLALAVANLRLGDALIPNAEFLVAGGTPIGRAAGSIGNVILGAYDVEYDLPARMLKLVRPRGCDGAALAYWTHSQAYSVADLDKNAGPPTIFGYVNGVQIRIAFDTGTSTSILDLRAAATAGITPQSAGAARGDDLRGIGASHTPTWIVPVGSVGIGEEEIRNTRLRIADISPTGVDMLLGTDFFLSHHVYFAMSQHRVYFSYGRGPVFGARSLQ